MPYRVTSTMTVLKPDEVVEWRHPVGHSWRWEFESLAPTLTRVTETFDYRDAGAIKNTLKYYERMGFRKANASGIEATLAKLRDRYAAIAHARSAIPRDHARDPVGELFDLVVAVQVARRGGEGPIGAAANDDSVFPLTHLDM